MIEKWILNEMLCTKVKNDTFIKEEKKVGRRILWKFEEEYIWCFKVFLEKVAGL